jgi:hypothetical protein
MWTNVDLPHTKKELYGSCVCDPRLTAVGACLLSTWRSQVTWRVMDVVETAEVFGSGIFSWPLAKSCEMHVSVNGMSVICMIYPGSFFNAAAFSVRS